MILPGRLLDARDSAFVGELTEADAAKVEIPHVSVLAAAPEAATDHARLELRLLFRSDDN